MTNKVINDRDRMREQLILELMILPIRVCIKLDFFLI